jgi:hypothetical protein
MAKEEYEDDSFDEDDEMSFDEDEEEHPTRVETRGRPKKEDTIRQIKQAVSKPSPVVAKPVRTEEETTEQDVYAYNQPARVGIARRSTNKPLGENDELLVGVLVEILNKLDRIEKNIG